MRVYHVSIAINPTEPLNCQTFDIRVWRLVRKYNLTSIPSSISNGRNELFQQNDIYQHQTNIILQYYTDIYTAQAYQV